MEIPSADVDAWNVANGTNPDRPTILRYRPQLEQFIGDRRYPKRLSVFWSYEADNSSGMPSDAQSAELGAFEDAITAALDPDRIGILAFVFTCSGQREWHFYVSDIDQVGARINLALADQPGLPIELQVEDDPEWDEFKNVLGKCSPGEVVE